MKVSNIKANGSGYYAPVKSSLQYIEAAIALYRIRYTLDEISSKFDKKYDHYMGIRFHDNRDVAIRIATAITREAKLELSTEDDLVLEGYIKSFVNSLSGSEMDEIILDGLGCCARADHWYTFEKEWN